MNVLILGANGVIARMVENSIINDRAFADVKLTMFLRDKTRVDDLLSMQSSAIEGDVGDLRSLEDAIEDQDIVIDTTRTTDPQTSRNIIEAMIDNGVMRIVSINSLGIYDEVPGKFGQWNRSMIGDTNLAVGQKSAQLYEASGLDYTILRLAWLNHEETIKYELTSKEEPFKGTSVSRQSVVNILLKIIDDPDYLKNQNVGVDEPGTDGNSAQL